MQKGRERILPAGVVTSGIVSCGRIAGENHSRGVPYFFQYSEC